MNVNYHAYTAIVSTLLCNDETWYCYFSSVLYPLRNKVGSLLSILTYFLTYSTHHFSPLVFQGAMEITGNYTTVL